MLFRRMTLFRSLPLAALLVLAACARPETRLRAGLTDAGLSPRLSDCMADRMVDRLSLWQLRKLSALRGVKRAGYGTLSVAEFLHKVRALRDQDILRVSTAAAGVCALGL